MHQPKHATVRQWIETEIRRGQFVEGQLLPTERELMVQFGVSRNPVQQAMNALAETGIVVRKRGFGTVVATAGLRSNLLKFVNPSSNDPEIAGYHRVLNLRITSASQVALSQSLMPPGTPVAELTRIKVSDEGLPIAYERCVIDLQVAPSILEQDLVSLTTIAYYNSIGISVRRASTVLSAVHLEPAEASELHVTPDTPVIKQRRNVYVGDGQLAEIGEFFIHPINVTLEVSQIDNS